MAKCFKTVSRLRLTHFMSGFARQLHTTRNAAALPTWNERPTDPVIVAARRTPIGKAIKGSLKDTPSDDLIATVFKAAMEDGKVLPKDIQDICMGNVLDATAPYSTRFAQFYSEIPEDVPVYTINRQCGSGLQAIVNVAGDIQNGDLNIGLAGGFESMSLNDFTKAFPSALNPRMENYPKTIECLTPVGITSENVAQRFGLLRTELDKFALSSQSKAKAAAEEGLFSAEIAPVTTIIKDELGQENQITVTKDDGIRPTTLEKLSELKPVFMENGSTTAGNSSQISDGAAVTLLMSRQEAEKRGLPILGILRSFGVKGCAPDIMGIGPVVAIPLALEKAGLAIDDVDIYEINEAFASQAFYCVRELGIPENRVNPKGGAIALGHPVGCAGARLVTTLLHELKRREQRSCGVVSMCMGTGMGMAAVFEYPGRTAS